MEVQGLSGLGCREHCGLVPSVVVPLQDHYLIQRPKGVKRMRKSWAGKEQKMGKMRLQNSSRKSLTTINTRAEKKTCSHRHWRGEHIATETWELRRQWRDYGSESTSFLKHRWSCAQSQTWTLDSTRQRFHRGRKWTRWALGQSKQWRKSFIKWQCSKKPKQPSHTPEPAVHVGNAGSPRWLHLQSRATETRILERFPWLLFIVPAQWSRDLQRRRVLSIWGLLSAQTDC